MAALKSHRHGDGHDRTHGLLAELMANVLEIAAAMGGKRRKVDPMRYLPWRKDVGEKNVDAKIKDFFRGKR